MKLYDENSMFNTVMSRVADLAMLNICWVIGCIPLVTIGTSTASLYECVRLLHEQHDSHIVRMFWHTYRNILQKTIAITMIFACCIALLTFNLWYIAHGLLHSSMSPVLYGITITIAAVGAFLTVYVLPVTSRSKLSIWAQFKQSAQVALLHPATTCINMGIMLIPWVLSTLLPGGLPFVIFFYGLVLYGISAYIVTALMLRSGIIARH